LLKFFYLLPHIQVPTSHFPFSKVHDCGVEAKRVSESHHNKQQIAGISDAEGRDRGGWVEMSGCCDWENEMGR
jgi:hypothetical protein